MNIGAGACASAPFLFEEQSMPKVTYRPMRPHAPARVTWCDVVFTAGQPVETDNPHILAKAGHNAEFVLEGAGGTSKRRRSARKPTVAECLVAADA
jgi:hypothetical protein